MREYYELLGLTESATDEEIKARYEEMKDEFDLFIFDSCRLE